MSEKVKALERDIQAKEGQVEAARGAFRSRVGYTTGHSSTSLVVRLERLENADREQMEKRKQSRTIHPVSRTLMSADPPPPAIYLSLLTHRSVIGQLRAEKRQLEEEVDELKRILKELSEGYNPNYQVRPNPPPPITRLTGPFVGYGCESRRCGLH